MLKRRRESIHRAASRRRSYRISELRIHYSPSPIDGARDYSVPARRAAPLRPNLSCANNLQQVHCLKSSQCGAHTVNAKRFVPRRTGKKKRRSETLHSRFVFFARLKFNSLKRIKRSEKRRKARGKTACDYDSFGSSNK